MDETLPKDDTTTRHNETEQQQQHQQQQQHHHHHQQQQQQQQQQQHQQEHGAKSDQQSQQQQLEHQKASLSLELQHDLNEQQQQQHQENHHQQQTPTGAPQSSSSAASSTIGSNILTNLRTNANLTKCDTSIPEELFSNKRWGTTPIRQDTPWELPPSPTQTQPNQQQQQPAQTSAIGTAGTSLAIPPGISQSGDSFHGQAMAAAVNNMGGLVGAPTSILNSRFEQPWRAPMAPSKQPTLNTSASFANHNLMNAAPGPMQKSFLNPSGNNQAAFSMQPGGDFARAPGPSPSILDANAMAQKPFGMAQRASTWSSFGSQPGPNDSDSEWPKTSTQAGISAGVNSAQSPSNAFDLVHEFEPGKSWHGSNLMKSLDDDSPINLGPSSMSAGFQGAYSFSAASKSPTGGAGVGSQFESSGMGTWSPVVKSGRSGSMWDGDGQDGGDGGRFDDGTAIWGNPIPSKITGVDWVEKTGDPYSNNDKSRPSNMTGNNQSNYRPQQSSSSSTSLLMSSNTSPSSQQNRNQQQNLNKPSNLSHNFDQVQQQSNALSSQANQPNRGLGLSTNVPSKHQQQLTTMVQQIQIAVQAGHLNPQILNQPLAPVTLQLLYQLLQQIRSLHQLQLKFNQPGSHQAAVSVQMTKTKQNILNLQNQIAAQQAMHLKQTQAHNISSRQPTMPNLATGGMGGNVGPTLPPGISQSGDSFRSSNSIGDFHGQAMVNNFGSDSMSANGLANSLSHMNLGGAGVMHSSRFDQPWRAPANKQHQSTMASSSFANHNLMNAAPGGMHKSMLNNSSGNGGSSYIGMQQGGEFARAPGPASSNMDNNLTPKPYGIANPTASTWSAFGNSSSNEPEHEWPKSAATSSGISSSNTTQPSNAFDLVPEFEPGKPWRGSMLMRSVEDDPTMTPGSMARSLAPQRKTIWSDEIL